VRLEQIRQLINLHAAAAAADDGMWCRSARGGFFLILMLELAQ
jgi:hypothetical protein